MNVFAILSTIIAALIGGWVGAYLQSRDQYKMNKVELMWQFRLKIHEAEQAMWNQTESFKVFEAPINWLRVAASDPRIEIDTSEVEKYATYLKNGRDDLLASIENAPEPCFYGINSGIIESVSEQAKNIDTMIISKIRKELK